MPACPAMMGPGIEAFYLKDKRAEQSHIQFHLLIIPDNTVCHYTQPYPGHSFLTVFRDHPVPSDCAGPNCAEVSVCFLIKRPHN